MRELKFRLWDNHTERYVTFVYEANKDCYLFIGRSGYVTAFNCYGEEIEKQMKIENNWEDYYNSPG